MSSRTEVTPSSISKTRIIQLAIAVLAVIAGLTLADTFLEQAEQTEVSTQAKNAHRNGLALLAQGKPAEAVDFLRRAHALERSNLAYELDLADALIMAGKVTEAEPLLNEVLEKEPNDGRANLLEAQLMDGKGKLVDAEAFYHRAIYGEWPSDATQHQIEVRFELIHFLLNHHAQNQMLAELLPLQAQLGQDPTAQQRLAHLFLLAGSPYRAADIYQSLIKRRQASVSVYSGLGEAELQIGDFHAAHAAFAAALAGEPANSGLQRRLDLAAQLTAMDPMPRWLASAEKYRRAIRIAELSADDSQQCIVNHPTVATEEAKKSVAEAYKALLQTSAAKASNEEAETLLALSQQLWQSRLTTCGTGFSEHEEPLRLIMEKLGR